MYIKVRFVKQLRITVKVQTSFLFTNNNKNDLTNELNNIFAGRSAYYIYFMFLRYKNPST